MDEERLLEIVAYYRAQGAPQDQQMLIAMLREAQESEGGVLTDGMIETIACAYGMKATLIQALIRRIPGLKSETAAHRLEVCGSCRTGAKLRDFIEKTYCVKSGGISGAAGFLYRVTPCMKNCRNGPSIRWDGKLYSGADEMLIRTLIEKK